MPARLRIFPWGIARLARLAFGEFALPAAALVGALLLVSVSPAAAATITLADVASSNYRWLNVADQAYEASYRSNYDYDNATVTFTYNPSAGVFGGTLTATNLKPNFAYQLKVSGSPGTASSERIGLAGRWWKETWNNTAHVWDNAENLNYKGTGYPPTPNDVNYFAWRDIPDPTSPTGLRYRFTGYLVFDYFITDDCGSASLVTLADSSYHVLYNTTQRGHTADDGPLKATTFDPNPASPAYDTDYPASTVTIFGEWERLPADGVFLAPGSYSAQMFLTEESFHGMGQYAGSWAAAMGGDVTFAIVPEPGTAALIASALAALVLRRRRLRNM